MTKRIEKHFITEVKPLQPIAGSLRWKVKIGDGWARTAPGSLAARVLGTKTRGEYYVEFDTLNRITMIVSITDEVG
jgi:hypothetical protein